MARKNTTDAFNSWCNRRPYKGSNAVWTDGQTIFSYSTPIVERSPDGHVKFNATRYSTTTSCQQNGLQWLLECKGIVAQEWTENN